jgi:hypothetical protein
MTPVQTTQPLVDDHVFLIGRPPLKQYVNFVKQLAVDSQTVDIKLLADEWRAANRHIRELEAQEAGWADKPMIGPLDPHLESLHKQVLKDPLFQHAFQLVPADIGMVELARLVVFQKHINLEYVRSLRKILGDAPSPEQIFRFCLPFDHPAPPLKWMRTHHNSYVFVSPSNDLRFLGPALLKDDQITGCPRPGVVPGVLGLFVGFGSNFLNAIHAENRLVLNNGSHRAFALREMGITHAPCIIQHVSQREELKAIGSSDLHRNPDLYLSHPRPSVLRDYFDPKLRKVVAVHRRLRQVAVTFEAEQTDVPAT